MARPGGPVALLARRSKILSAVLRSRDKSPSRSNDSSEWTWIASQTHASTVCST